MSDQPTLFDLSEGERRKDAALDYQALTHADVLGVLRHYLALRYQLQHQRFGDRAYVSSDDAWLWLHERQLLHHITPATLGAVFRSEEWEPTGQWIKSTRPSNHARQSMCWRLKA